MNKKFTQEELESQCYYVMGRFNFEKVHTYMKENEHKWLIGGELRVPELDELRWQARSLLVKAAWSESETINVGTGGFMAYKMPWGMSLTFQIAWS